MGPPRRRTGRVRDQGGTLIHLCFHGIGTCRQEREPGEAAYWVSRDLFLAVLDSVVGHDDVHLSFDDGNRSDVDIALPALVERGLSADFFPLAGRLNDPESLNATHLRTLHIAGMPIGSHGWNHIPWRGLHPEETNRELVEARRVLSDASGAPVTTAALPLGRYDRRLLSELRRHGYERVFMSDRFPASPRAWLVPRFSIKATDTVASVRPLLSASKLKNLRNATASKIKRVR